MLKIRVLFQVMSRAFSGRFLNKYLIRCWIYTVIKILAKTNFRESKGYQIFNHRLIFLKYF